MRRLFSWGLILLCVVYLVGCSTIIKSLEEVVEQEDSEATQPAKKLGQAEDLLEQMKKEMEKMAGYSWESQGQQQMNMVEGTATTAFQYGMDFLDNSHYMIDIEVKVSAGRINNVMEMEVIRDGDQVYFYEPILKKWERTREVPEEMTGLMGMEYFDPVELVSLLSPHANQIMVAEEGQHWKLTLELQEHKEITPFMKYAIENFQRNKDVKANDITFSDLKMTMLINKSNHQLSQVEQSLKVNMPMTSGDNLDISQNWTNKFKGEVKELTIPDEAKNAPFVEE